MARLLAVTSVTLAACASPSPPTDQVAVATAAVDQAVGAGSVQGAPLETKTAQDKLVRANAAMAAKDYEGALLLAQQAQVDAQLAQARTEAIKARKAADETQQAARALRDEMNRSAK